MNQTIYLPPQPHVYVEPDNYTQYNNDTILQEEFSGHLMATTSQGCEGNGYNCKRDSYYFQNSSYEFGFNSENDKKKFTPRQLLILEDEFQFYSHKNGLKLNYSKYSSLNKTIIQLAGSFGRNVSNVKLWFQNRRVDELKMKPKELENKITEGISQEQSQPEPMQEILNYDNATQKQETGSIEKVVDAIKLIPQKEKETNCPLDDDKTIEPSAIENEILDLNKLDIDIAENYLEFVFTWSDQNLKSKITKMFLMNNNTFDSKEKLQHLIVDCENSILESINENNVIGYYQCGERIKSDKIIKTCFEFMKENKQIVWKTEKQFVQSCDELPSLMYRLLI